MTKQLRTAGILAALVAVAGLVGSAGVATLVAGEQRDAAQQQLDRRASLVAAAVTAEAGRYVDTLSMVAAGLGGSETLTAARFEQAVQPLDDMRLAGAASVGFLVPSSDDDVAATQARWRARGVPKLSLRPTDGSSEHIFSVVSRRFDGRPTTTGTDFSTASAPAQALARSRRTGQVTVSDAYQLLSDRQLPATRQQLSFALTAPVYGPATTAGERQFRGWVVMAMRGQDFMGATLTRLSQNLIDVTLHAPGVDGTQLGVAALTAGLPGKRDLSRTTDVSVADRTWSLTVDSVAKRLPGGVTRLPLLVTAVGTLLGLLSAGLVWVLATGRARAEARVRAATARLSTARDELLGQKTYLMQVLDTLDTAVLTCDNTGAIVHANHAVYDWTRVDDRTGAGNPGADDLDRALARALFGQSVRGEEMTIEPAGRPRRNLLVDARPLHDHTGRIIGAVCSASDITVLRDREADLEAFAGVVAHDLKGPLGGVAGFAEILDDHLDAGTTEPTQLRPALDRIRSGTDRMRGLIDDLLAYATARDAQLHREPVDLRALVAEVVNERTAPLRASGTPEAQLPTIHTGPLPVVHADPAMIRQLLDNLIGNALKYTRPGQPAQIAISSQATADGTAVIEIADRGIGIPAADQPHVFTSFHRSASHRGYAGTGLGLSICQRIVDRHEGTITVSDNPGGGTRMRFTLPGATDLALPTMSHPTYTASHQGRLLASPFADV
ncbi:ATP-binding protein [Krasilnikovia cinnamomea]|uniref:ATP-binding protein n=1 Tax=Krasilnikovia cinnamomea TaxID=349313 RepID=UPI00102B4E92|nr:ATP-binding protein [Krasilnikovia cinnamomea]